MAHLSAIFGMVGSSDTTRFGSLEFPTLPPVGTWVPPIFEPSQAFLFESLDFITDWLDVLHLYEEALVLAPIEGAASPIDSRTPSNFNDEVPVLRSEPTLGSNPTVSNIHTVLYSHFHIFRRLSGGIPLSLPRPPGDRFPYGLASLMDAYAWGLQKKLAPPPLTSEFMGMAGYAPASFHDLMDDDVESDV